MNATAQQILVNSLYLVALINPISKISVLTVLTSERQGRALRALANKASLVAAGILLGAMVFGEFMLRVVFHVELHALQLAGGAVLFWTGFSALRKGVFFEQETQRGMEDMALVPLACPMIAGPATITASIALHAKEGFWAPAASLLLAIAVNHLAMRASDRVGRVLSRFNMLGALIRITGLLVMTIGVQMALDGIAVWRAAVGL
jgi:multiple antibiotic resistance protein